ncbi:MAG: hypothetical protein QNL99_09045 [SAR86 cluster bacterium]
MLYRRLAYPSIPAFLPRPQHFWNGDPLEVTSRPVKMMIDGAWVSLTTRQTLLRDRYADLQDTEIPFGYR